MKKISDLSKEEYASLMVRGGVAAQDLSSMMGEIFQKVSVEGDSALASYTQKFGSKPPENIVIGKDEIAKIAARAGLQVVEALEIAAKRIREFAQAELPRSWQMKFGNSVMGKKVSAIGKAGIYVPGGTAAYPSTVLMCCIPAKVAGVSEIVVCTPPKADYNPAIFAALKIAGIEKVFAVGGAQAIAAMALGTQSIPKVDKIVGPGNSYVNAAKKYAASLGVAIDSPAGPSEVLIIADVTAKPCWIAADLLAQAEHDADASAILVTTSERLASDVEVELKNQLERLPRKEIAGKSLEKSGKILVADTITQAVDFANAYAPEHLEILAKGADRIAEKITNAGAIFIGEWSCEALADYGFGPNHTLPTGGAARAYSGLSSGAFCKESSIMIASEEESKAFAKTAAVLARAEGLEAHARSARKRAS